jgi:hypothetical protein
MTARRSPVPRESTAPCANPLCARRVDSADDDVLVLNQRQAGHVVTWHTCGVGCLRTFLALSEIRQRAKAEVRA